MLNKFASLVLVIALVSTLGGSSAFANSPTKPDAKRNVADGETEISDKDKVQPNEKLKADMVKLITDAKAGKVAPAERPQIQPAKSNNLSKGTKIAIGVGIAIAVVVVIVIAKADKGPGQLGIF
jgi:capsular polysaccharide biosynthesis protein